MKLHPGAMVIVSTLAFGQTPYFKNERSDLRVFQSHLSASSCVDSFELEAEGRLLVPARGGFDEAAPRVFPGGAADQQSSREPDDRQVRTVPPVSLRLLTECLLSARQNGAFFEGV